MRRYLISENVDNSGWPLRPSLTGKLMIVSPLMLFDPSINA